MFFITENVLSNDQIYYWKDLIANFYHNNKSNNPFAWKNRTIDISNESVVQVIKEALKNQINIDLELAQAQLQVWPEGSESKLHIHNDYGRRNTTFNSLLYLNDDFEGGEFYTKNITIKPKTGTLTLFNGREELHGVKKVIENHRYTMIFWWK